MLKWKMAKVLIILICLTSINFAQSKWEWKKINSMNCTRRSHVIERIGDEKIIVIGGSGESPTGVSANFTVEILDSVTGNWRFTEPLKISRVAWHKTVKLDNNKLFLVGGLTNQLYETQSCELFDIDNEKWSFADSTILNHQQKYTLTKLNDGRILLTGGIKDFTALERFVKWNQCEIFDPKTNKWKLTDSMSIGRASHSALLLKNGCVLVAGGEMNGEGIKSCEVFDPVTEKWSAFPEMTENRFGFTLLLKMDGTIVASAGDSKSLEVYEDGESKWIKKAGLNILRNNSTPIQKKDGNVMYCAGGVGVPQTYEEYDLNNFFPVFLKAFDDTIDQATYTIINGDRIVQAGGSKVIIFQGNPYLYNVSSCYVYTSETIPVELTQFTGFAGDGKVTLNWSTATETNNRGFEIERKTPNSSYEKTGYVPGAGTTTIPRKYSFTDNVITNGIIFYRLKQIDYDGKFEYSKEIEMNSSAPLIFDLMQNYPNPFNPATKIRYQVATAGVVNIRVYDVLGRQVAQLVNETQNPGTYEAVFDGSKHTSGMYIYEIKVNGFTASKKMILLQ